MKFEINGKEYEGAKYDYNAYCSISEMGIPMDKFMTDPFVGVRAYLALSGNMSLDKAGKEIEKHIISGGSLKEVSDVFAAELNKSGFFQIFLDKMKETVEKEMEEETEETPAETPKKTTRKRK